ncbi:1-phosphofructokinase OS=Streptomyces tendae OX=1932 GN=pfkB PE=3 SV=1 [Streptomyces tendae]
MKAAEELRELGARSVLASLGADGQLLVDDAAPVRHRPPPGSAPPPWTPYARNVGAGDSSLAGFLVAGGTGPGTLASAVAHGAAAVQLPGSAMPTPYDLDQRPP